MDIYKILINIIICLMIFFLFISIIFKTAYYNQNNDHINWHHTLLNNGKVIKINSETCCDTGDQQLSETNSPDNTLVGNLYYFDNISQEVILICPSFSDNITYHQNIILNIYKLGYKIYIFNYPGFGNNKNIIKNEQNILNYSNLVLQYIIKIHPKLYINLLGIQFGAVIASYLVTEHKLQKLILLNPVISAKNYVTNIYPFLKYINFIFYEYNITKYLKQKQQHSNPTTQSKYLKILSIFYTNNPKSKNQIYHKVKILTQCNSNIFNYYIKNEDNLDYSLFRKFINEKLTN